MRRKIRNIAVIICLGICLSGITTGWTAPVSKAQARQAFAGWIAANSAPFDLPLGMEITSVESLADEGYVVYLASGGMAIMPGDDRIEPVLAFAANGIFDPKADHPLTVLVRMDLQSRLRFLKSGQTPRSDCTTRAAAMWQVLQARAGPGARAHLENTSDLRVPALLQSAWDQKTVGGELCYNYYTPNHYPCGCVATAMAQLMRYHRHPAAAVGPRRFEVVVEHDPNPYQTLTIKGGDGNGGAYNWDMMPDNPGADTPAVRRQTIGALCFDAGIAVNMRYGPMGSGADMLICMQALGQVFYFDNVIYGWQDSAYIAGLPGMLNPNLDAGLPALLAVSGSGGYHAILCDGYGYHNGILYHHLNMGWGENNAADNVWYALPNIDATLEFNCINTCLYNIFPGGTGEIISGRISDAFGHPIADALITAVRSGGGIYQARSNRRGIYALPGLPDSSTYALTVVKPGYIFPTHSAVTGHSRNYEAFSGNCAGMDFVGSGPYASEPIVYPIVGDWNGNGRAELALYRDDAGTWLIRMNGQTSNLVFGATGCQPVLADFDGDGLADPGLYHGELGLWGIRLSSQSNATVIFSFGCAGAHPAAGDFDGDGKADPALYQESAAQWCVLLSGRGYAAATFEMGGAGCRPVAGLFDNDNKADPVLFEYASGTWRIYLSARGYQPVNFVFGAPGDLPAAGDFDGDGLADPAFYRYISGTWNILLSGSRYASVAITFF